MVYTLTDHKNDVIKCSKLKRNNEPSLERFSIALDDKQETSKVPKFHISNARKTALVLTKATVTG